MVCLVIILTTFRQFLSEEERTYLVRSLLKNSTISDYTDKRLDYTD